MSRRIPGGYSRRFKGGSVGEPRKVRALKQRQANDRDRCHFPSDCGCLVCQPDPYDETDERA